MLGRLSAARVACNAATSSRLFGALFAAGLLALVPTASADEIEDFYKGRQVTIVTGGEAGNDYDQWARLIARHFGRQIPGNPILVVQNMPGAGQITATNHLYNVADQDGSIIGMIGRNLPYFALTGEKNVRYEPAKFNWLGSPETARRVCAVRDDSEVKSADDLFQKEALMGGAGAGGAISNTPVLLQRLLGLKFKLIEGYKSGSGVMLAVERKEIDGICISYNSLRPERSGSIKWTHLFNLERDPIPGTNIPTVYKYAKNDQQAQVIALYNSSVEIGRPVLVPPGVPAARVEALRKSFIALTKDPQFMADAEKQKLEIDLVPGDKLQKMIVDLMNTPKEIVELTNQMTK